MTRAAPAVIATLQARTAAETGREIRVAARAAADLAELRTDRWTPEEREKIPTLFPSELPLLVTLRSQAEGGEGTDLPNERREILTRLLDSPFHAVDFEWERDREWVQRSDASAVNRPGLVRIWSHHVRTPPSASEIRELTAPTNPRTDWAKLVGPATVSELLDQILPTLENEARPGWIVHTTGPSGPLLRVWSRRFEMPAVFGTTGVPPSAGPVEPAQLPVEQLRRYFRDPSDSCAFAVFGTPIARSRSPWLHSRWMREEDRTGIYVPLEILTSEEFVRAVGALSRRGFRGVNVTRPWKRTALTVATRVAPPAERSGCANMLSFSGSEVVADNTDVGAVLRRLRELIRARLWDGREVTVLGAGGAARAAVVAGTELGSRIQVVARNPDAALALGREVGGEISATPRPEPVPLVIHATPAGQAPEPRVPDSWRDFVGAGTHVLDFVYEPDDPFLRDLTRLRHATYEDGWRLLVYQAAESYSTWWGSELPPERIDSAVAEGSCAG